MIEEIQPIPTKPVEFSITKEQAAELANFEDETSFEFEFIDAPWNFSMTYLKLEININAQLSVA